MKYLLFIFLFICGCASTEMFQSYKIGEVKTVPVGGELISWGSTITHAMQPGAGYKETTTSSLVFNGSDQNTIFIAYREKYGDALNENYGKAAMNNELKYPISSKMITYQDHQIEVISLANNDITVRIIK